MTPGQIAELETIPPVYGVVVVLVDDFRRLIATAKDVERLKAERDELLERLKDLVQLRKHKDIHGKDSIYEKARPIVWLLAEEAIAKVQK